MSFATQLWLVVMKKISFTVRIPSRQADWLRGEAGRLGISVTELLRRLVDKWMGEG